MKVIAKNTLPEWNITAGRSYEVVKIITSTEIGKLYQVTADDGKLKNLKATHFYEEGETTDAHTITGELIDMHRRQYNHNKQRFEDECRSIISMMTPADGCEAVNIEDVKEFLEGANEYLMAMMFHINSLHVVGLKLAG